MKSGLEGRNNDAGQPGLGNAVDVSMKSGLEGRNNLLVMVGRCVSARPGLNEVRPRRPEQ